MIEFAFISLGLAFVIVVTLLTAKQNAIHKQHKEDAKILKEINDTLVVKSTNLFAELETQRLKNGELVKDLLTTKALLDKELNKNTQIIHQKKSSETRLGQISEQLAPFLGGFKYDPKTAHFLGSPLDYVIFDVNSDDPAVVFVEIKTGNSKLSTSQKTIKNLIKSGKVRFEELRIDPKGQKTKITKSEDEE